MRALPSNGGYRGQIVVLTRLQYRDHTVLDYELSSASTQLERWSRCCWIVESSQFLRGICDQPLHLIDYHSVTSQYNTTLVPSSVRSTAFAKRSASVSSTARIPVSTIRRAVFTLAGWSQAQLAVNFFTNPLLTTFLPTNPVKPPPFPCQTCHTKILIFLKANKPQAGDGMGAFGLVTDLVKPRHEGALEACPFSLAPRSMKIKL